MPQLPPATMVVHRTHATEEGRVKGMNKNDPHSAGRALPPYEGRREAADVCGEEPLRKDGANIGGAIGLVESDEMKSPPEEDTPQGAGPSPSDEQPASGMPETALDRGAASLRRLPLSTRR